MLLRVAVLRITVVFVIVSIVYFLASLSCLRILLCFLLGGLFESWGLVFGLGCWLSIFLLGRRCWYHWFLFGFRFVLFLLWLGFRLLLLWLGFRLFLFFMLLFVLLCMFILFFYSLNSLLTFFFHFFLNFNLFNFLLLLRLHTRLLKFWNIRYIILTRTILARFSKILIQHQKDVGNCIRNTSIFLPISPHNLSIISQRLS